MSAADDRKPVDAPTPEEAAAPPPGAGGPTILEQSVNTYPAFTWEVVRGKGEDTEDPPMLLQIVIPGPYIKVFQFPFDDESAKKLAGKLMSANIEIASPADLQGLAPEGRAE